MYGTANKKMLNMLILQILSDYSDSNHRLTQQDIIKHLEHDYGISCDRRSVKNNLISLMEMEYEISMEQGIFLQTRSFEDSELRMLIDSVLFSKAISSNQAQELILKLKKQGTKYFEPKVSHVINLPELQHSDNKQIMYSLDVLNDAIETKKKVSFTYNTYGTDFKYHPKRDEKYIVSPYQMVANNGKYYLIGNYEKYENISHYRIDRMTDVVMLNEKVKDLKRMKEFANGFNLPKHMAEHIYMYSGESVVVKLKTTKSMMDELVDWFGKEFRVLKEDEGNIIVRVKCNERAMLYWALQYGMSVEVREPVSLRHAIQEAIGEMYETYHKE